MEVLTVTEFKKKVFDFEANSGGPWKFAGDTPTIIDFYADWCGPCRSLSPILEELATEYKGRVNIFKVNTESTPELAALFGVRGIPALLFVPQSGEPTMSSGFMPKAALQEAITDIFNIKP
jgi:thioredoxin 1